MLQSLISSFPLPSTELSLRASQTPAFADSLVEFLTPTLSSSTSVAWITSPENEFDPTIIFFDEEKPAEPSPPSPTRSFASSKPSSSSASSSTSSARRHRERRYPSTKNVARFHYLTHRAEKASRQISAVLLTLVANSQHHVETTRQLTELQMQREEILLVQQVAQRRSKELLTEVKKEMETQESWRYEIRTLFDNAEGEGLDIGGDRQQHWAEVETLSDDICYESDTVSVSSTEERLLMEKRELYERQLMYLTASLASSEQQTATLLVHIASTSPASVSTTEELARLHAATRAVTMHLEQLVEERDAAHDKLAKLQTRRDEAEAKRELMALEFVLGWEKQKREAAKKARKGVEV